MNADDRIRRRVIGELICHFELDQNSIEERFGIAFDDYFAAEQAEIESFIADGLVERRDRVLTVTAAGRLLIRRICMAFDAYIPKQAPVQGFSRII
ncbi:hypothetical protein [Marinobacterium aestuariivivens]|uniref:HemN C-terminal domain-containing protein n=1 Tax=Marinobacterium aestuariivivens TaxID=1698799 RepID=A0ABW2A8B7_9GAMM